MANELIPVISLFSGCGGMDLGFLQEDFNIVLAIDKAEFAVKTYNFNHHQNTARTGDLSKLTGKDIVALLEKVSPGVRPRGIIGGPPCQSFSLGNVHNKTRDPRHKLPLHYARILKTLNRKYQLDFFVFENVVGLKSSRHEEHFDRILIALEDAGFHIFEEQLDASRFSVPQSRNRVFVVGINKHLYPNLRFQFPKGTTGEPRTVRDTIYNFPEPRYFSHKLGREDIPFHPNHWTMNPRSPKFKNTNIDKKPDSLNGRSFRRLDWDRPSWTVAYGNREIHVHPNGNRRLSIFEAMKLQDFPDSYELLGNLTQQVKQVSDAVPPPLARAIAKKLQKSIYSSEREIQKRLLDWFEKNHREFPWRNETDPYAVLIAEKLLQQTSANSKVISAYENILADYPTVEALSKAKSEDIERIIASLGFKYRANELPRIARQIIDNHEGKIPKELNQLLNLQGVGDYISRAVLCFGYGQDVSVVDTNIARFLYRMFGLPGSLPSNPARNRKLINQASNLVPSGNASDFNWAVLDLCAMICSSSNPSCEECPLQDICHYGSSMTKEV